MPAAAKATGRKPSRKALLAGVVVALLAYVYLRRRGTPPAATVQPATDPTAGVGTIDPGAAGGSGSSGALDAIQSNVSDLTSWTALLEADLQQLATTSQATSDQLASRIDQVAGKIPTAADIAAQVKPPAPPTTQGASGQQPATAPGNTNVAGAPAPVPVYVPPPAPAGYLQPTPVAAVDPHSGTITATPQPVGAPAPILVDWSGHVASTKGTRVGGALAA